MQLLVLPSLVDILHILAAFRRDWTYRTQFPNLRPEMEAFNFLHVKYGKNLLAGVCCEPKGFLQGKVNSYWQWSTERLTGLPGNEKVSVWKDTGIFV